MNHPVKLVVLKSTPIAEKNPVAMFSKRFLKRKQSFNYVNSKFKTCYSLFNAFRK